MQPKALLIAILLLFAAVTPIKIQAQKSNRNAEVIILHVNDMHSKIDNFGKLAYLFDSLKASHPYVFLVAAGDNFTGNPIVDMYPDKGYPMIDLMNMVGFNLTAIGNHEFDMGQTLQNKRRKQANFQFISANIDASNAEVKQPKPYQILKAGKIKIPVVSAIQLGENGKPDSHPSRLEGIKFVPAMEKLQEYMWLKDKYGILIGLTHLGVEIDEPLAEKYPQFDLIIGGHSHTVISKPMIVNNVLIAQAGSGLKYVGKVTLKISDGKITERKSELIAMSSLLKSKPEVQSVIDKYNSNEEMNQVVGIAETPFANEDELGCMMTDAITARFGVDFAFQNGGGIRISSLPAGNIYLKDIFRLDPFGNQVVTYKMSVPEIISLIKNAYNREKTIDLQASGMTYIAVIDTDGNCIDVEIKDKNGNQLDPSKTYTVGLNSYISASYKFDHADPGETNYNTSAQTLLDYLKDVKAVNYSGVKRVSVRKLEQ